MNQLRTARVKAGLTQDEAAARLDLSQPYLSQLERGQRRVTERVARAAARLYELPPTALSLPARPLRKTDVRRLPRELAALSYPGYEHLRPAPPANPALVLLEALSENDLDARVTEALPWVLVRYSELDWDWLLTHAKLRNLQNRLGFLVSVARELSERHPDRFGAAPRLRKAERELEQARLAAETTLGRDSMPPAERAWLRANRPPGAERWNVLTSMTADQLPYAA
ncbi:MAG: helix-turn-helix domain-containing protein [Thermoanaerobaculia bacterium]